MGYLPSPLALWTFFFFFFFFLDAATDKSFQGRGQNGPVSGDQHHTFWALQIPDPLSEARD